MPVPNLSQFRCPIDAPGIALGHYMVCLRLQSFINAMSALCVERIEIRHEYIRAYYMRGTDATPDFAQKALPKGLYAHLLDLSAGPLMPFPPEEPAEITYVTGAPSRFIATRAFALGATGMLICAGDEVLFDGSTLGYKGEQMNRPEIRGAVKVGWLKAVAG